MLIITFQGWQPCMNFADKEIISTGLSKYQMVSIMAEIWNQVIVALKKLFLVCLFSMLFIPSIRI